MESTYWIAQANTGARDRMIFLHNQSDDGGEAFYLAGHPTKFTREEVVAGYTLVRPLDISPGSEDCDRRKGDRRRGVTVDDARGAV